MPAIPTVLLLNTLCVQIKKTQAKDSKKWALIPGITLILLIFGQENNILGGQPRVGKSNNKQDDHKNKELGFFIPLL